MPVVNRIADMNAEIAGWRQEIHSHPELGYQEQRTSAKVAETLRSLGVDEVVTGIGRTGVVGVIRGRNAATKAIGLRADMDALPIQETTGLPYASQNPGVMHACGHDGHTAMLLGTAKYLAETRNFDGSAVLIFQPAEEGGAGAKAMLDDGLLERFGIHEVYGMHNMPGLPIGNFAIRSGSLMAAADTFGIALEGHGGHAARPHTTIDTLLVGTAIVQAVQSIVARNVDPLESGVISITKFHAGHASNIIPQTADLAGTVRTLKGEVQDLLEKRLRIVVEQIAAAYGAKATLTYTRGYPVTVNHAAETDFAVSVASEIAGADRVNSDVAPMMGAEDFSYMLEKRPGAFIFVGNGESANLHHPAYNFNDDAIPVGVSYFSRLIETRLSGA